MVTRMVEIRSTGAPIQVQGLDHVTIVTKDLERSRRFYCDLLGMAPAERPDFAFPGLWFRAGTTQIHLILETEGCARPGDLAVSEETQAGLAHHFAFEVADAADAAEHLRAHGVRIMGGPLPRPDGCIQVWFFDPDGYVVEVFDRARMRGSSPGS